MQTGKDQDEYLTQIRNQMARVAASDAEKRNLLVFQGQLPKEVLSVSYENSVTHIILHADLLFEQNSSTIRNGSVDILNRLRALIAGPAAKLLITDSVEDFPDSKTVDGERILEIVGILEFPTKDASQEALTTETLAVPN